MTRNLIAANWKSHKSIEETITFFETLTSAKERILSSQTDIVICPTFHALHQAKTLKDRSSLPIMIGAQNISPFDEGAYTGEVAANQIKDLVSYVIIGHSERRAHFGETDEVIAEKVKRAKEVNLSVILCVQDAEGQIHEGVDVVAYEPISAIGTGNPDSPENVEEVLQKLRDKNSTVRLLYGGSVDKNSIHTFTKIPNLDGFLVGGASLDPESFLHLIAACDTRSSR